MTPYLYEGWVRIAARLKIVMTVKLNIYICYCKHIKDAIIINTIMTDYLYQVSLSFYLSLSERHLQLVFLAKLVCMVTMLRPNEAVSLLYLLTVPPHPLEMREYCNGHGYLSFPWLLVISMVTI